MTAVVVSSTAVVRWTTLDHFVSELLVKVGYAEATSAFYSSPPPPDGDATSLSRAPGLGLLPGLLTSRQRRGQGSVATMIRRHPGVTS